MDAVSYEDLRDDYLLCRTVLHSWNEVIADDLERPNPGFWWFVLSCNRCTARRIDLIDQSGDVASRRYTYPDGYELDEKINEE